MALELHAEDPDGKGPGSIVPPIERIDENDHARGSIESSTSIAFSCHSPKTHESRLPNVAIHYAKKLNEKSLKVAISMYSFA